MVPSPGPRPNQPPRMKDFGGDIDIEGVAGRRIDEAIDALGDVRHGEERHRQAEAGGGGKPDHPDEAHARHVEQRAPHQRDQHGLTEIGLHHQQRHHDDKQHQGEGVGRHLRTLGQFTEQPGDQDHESGLQELRRLDVDAEDHQPAPRAFDLGAEIRGDGNQDETDGKHDHRDLPDLARRQKRGRDQDAGGGNEKQHLTVDEVKRVEPMRRATGGLAARHSMMPPSISAPSAANVSRSTVHHHSENGVGCAREVMVARHPSPGEVPA